MKSMHVLVLGDLDNDEPLSQWIDDHACVDRVSTIDQALAALRSDTYDIVISRASDLASFEGVHISRQTAAIMDSVSQGVCLMGDDGELDWANPKMLNFAEDVRQRVVEFCMETFRRWQRTDDTTTSVARARRLSFTSGEGQYYEVSATPVVDSKDRIKQVVAVVWNATNSKRLQEKVDAIDRAGQELLSLDVEQLSRLDAQERLALLEQKIIRCTKELLHFDNFEIRVTNRRTNQLDLVLFSGIPSHLHDADLYVGVDGNGICGYVAARGKSYICPDTSSDRRYLAGIDGSRSSLTVPLRLHDEVVGVANFESTKLAAFDEDARQFAEILARYVALALHVLELLVSERRTTTGQLGHDVMTEITGPLNDILTDVEGLVEDYIGHDDLRHRLRKISENVVVIRDSVKDVTSTKAGLVGARSSRKKLDDPVLRGKTVLIADDEDTIRETVHDVLAGYGCKVHSVSDGIAAIELIEKESFDLVLSDIKMPGKDGYQVFAAAKEANAATPVILTTGFGYDPNHAIVRARREGLSAVLFKPFKVDQLLAEIRMALNPAQ